MHIKDLCTSCNYWTITDIQHDGKTATFTCTHCQNSFEKPWDTETRFLIRSIRQSLKKRMKEHPQLKTLKNPGDYVTVENINEQ